MIKFDIHSIKHDLLINSIPLLLTLVTIGLIYIVVFSLIYLKKAYTRCLEMGITKEELKKVIKSSVVFSIVPSLSIVVGLFAVCVPVLLFGDTIQAAVMLTGLVIAVVILFHPLVKSLICPQSSSRIMWKKGIIKVVDKNTPEFISIRMAPYIPVYS